MHSAAALPAHLAEDCFPKINSETFLSHSVFASSWRTKTTSKRLSNGDAMLVFTETSSDMSYFPLGLVAAMTVVRVFNEHTMPAFATERDCCSMASWIVARSWARMDENSSMQHTPRSARTRAPASSMYSCVELSRSAVHVRPALVVPIPVVSTDRGLTFAAKRRNWLFPVPGSPTSRR